MSTSAKTIEIEKTAETGENLPEGWADACIPDLIGAEGIFCDGDWIESKDQDPSGDVRLIQLADVGDGSFRDRSNRFLTSAKAKQLGCTFLTKGDILLARMPDPLGRACIFPGDKKPSVTAVDVCIVRPSMRVNGSWLMHAFNSPSFRATIEEQQKGTTRGRVSRSSLALLRLSVPPADEQKRIAEQVERLLNTLGKAHDRIDRTARIVSAFRQAVLAAACSGTLTEDWREENPDVEPADALIRKLGARRKSDDLQIIEGPRKLPESWTWVTFGSLIGELRNGISTKPEIDPPGKPILRISAVRSGQVTLDHYRYLRAASDFSEYLLRDCDLLFTRYNGTLELLGVCGMVRGLKGKTLLYPDKLMRARFDHALVLPAYAEIFFGSPQARDRITEKAKSSAGQQGVSGADVKAQPFSFPPTEEQKEIVWRVEALFKLADAIEKRVAAATLRAERLTQAVLAKVFRGELVPTEAELARREGREYEPASVLLERIRLEREKGAQKPKRGKKARLSRTQKAAAI